MSETASRDFIRDIVASDVAAGRNGGRVATRFPPEPNGFLHIGHAKAICLDFGIAEEFDGVCHLRMDDTNPEKEDPSYVDAIARDVRWLGFHWDGPIRYASDYFSHFYELALGLIEDGKAFVDSLSEEEIREYRGTVKAAGRPSPYRDRSPEESRDLFVRMRQGEFPDGAHVLRAKIGNDSPNMKMRDPLLFRIRHATHYRTGDEWPIYPMYDWAHPLSDAIEGITHSLCTLEFENNRELYDWIVENTRPAAIGLSSSEEPGAWEPRPRQYEFARLNLDYTVMSKRKLLRLVESGHVEGWDDPRMPTLAGYRRRGVPPEAIRAFCDEIGVARADNRVEIAKLEHATRDELNQRAPRVMCVVNPLRVVLDNWPPGETVWLDAPYFPHDVGKEGSRKVPFSGELYIERDDFREDPPKGFYRLAPGREVRLRYGYFIRCTEVLKDEEGAVEALHCTYDPDTKGGSAPDGRKVRGTIHWVSVAHAVACEVRLYDRLFSEPDPEKGDPNPERHLNPDSLRVVTGARIEPSVAQDPPDTHYQFERQGYFIRDPDSTPGNLLFNRTVPLKDSWAKREDGRASGGRPARARRRAGDSKKSSAGAGASDAGGALRERRAGRAKNPDRLADLAGTQARYTDELGLSAEEAKILTESSDTAGFFEEALREHDNPQAVANWIIHELRGAVGGGTLADLPFGGRQLGELVALVEEGVISRHTAKTVVAAMREGGSGPREIVESLGLAKIDDVAELQAVVEDVLATHPKEVQRYGEGHDGLLGFFVGRVMRETEGRADPQVARTLLRQRLVRDHPQMEG